MPPNALIYLETYVLQISKIHSKMSMIFFETPRVRKIGQDIVISFQTTSI